MQNKKARRYELYTRMPLILYRRRPQTIDWNPLLVSAGSPVLGHLSWVTCPRFTSRLGDPYRAGGNGNLEAGHSICNPLTQGKNPIKLKLVWGNKKNSKDSQHINLGKHTGAGPWWALPWALPWALGPPLGSLPGHPLGPPGALRGSAPVGAPTNM